jgi:hypothetical protein
MQTNELVRPAERGAVAALDRLPERENAAGRFTAPGASDAISTNCFDTECYTCAFSSFTAE